VHPLEVERVNGIFLTLKPIAGDVRKYDLDEAVGPVERLPIGKQRDRFRAEVGPD
jgi:hypothetical protein